jgi:CHAT domain-containing protein
MPLLTAQSSVLAPGPPVRGALDPGDQRVYTLTLGADDCARLELYTDLHLGVTLRQPDGTTSTLIDDAGAETAPQPLTVVARAPGAYAIELRLPKAEKGGPYRLRLEPVGPATEADRQHMQGESLLREGLRLFTQTARESRLSAADRYRKAADIFRAVGDQPMEAKAIDKTGQVYNRLGETRLALEAYERVLGLFRALGDRGNEASTLNNIGLERVNQGAYAEAIEPLKTAAGIFHDIGDYWTERSPTNNLGMAYYFLGDVEKATEQYRRALQIAQSNFDESGESYAYMGLAGLALLKGHLQDALNDYSRAIDGYRRLGNHQLEALALSNIGVTHLRFGDAQSALDYLLRAQEVRKLAPNRLNEVNTLGSIASAYSILGQPRKALDFANTEIRFWHELGNRGSEAIALCGLGRIQLKLGELESAAASYEAARSLANESANRQAQVFALAGLSDVRLQQHRPADAQSLATEALSIARQGGLRSEEERALMALADAEAASNALEAARDHASQAIAIAESIRSSVAGPDQRSGYLRQHYDEYELLVDVLMRLHRERPAAGFDRQAFDVSERARARTLIDLLTESRSNIREGVEPALVSREQALRAALSLRRGDSDEQVQSLLADYRALQNDLRARSPRYASLVAPQAAALDTIQHDLLDADTTLVEYALGDARSYVWVASARSLTSHELPSRGHIETLARRAYDALSQPQAPGRQEALRALGQVVIDPIKGQLSGKRLAIVTEGALQYIPFAALPDSAGAPLIRSYEFVSLPSGSTLHTIRRDSADRTPAARAVFVVGDPVFDRRDSRVRGAGASALVAQAARLERSAREAGAGDLERLWFTRREADSIAMLARQQGVEKLVDFEASLDRVTGGDLASYRVVHFATHGLLNNKHPELSGLVFSLVDARGQPRDGFLPAYEVYNLRLNADLVVLSACQTALGEDIRGEGLVGLTRAFMYAGTPRVVASLWRVPDSATAALMQRFYRALLVERRPPAESLRVAQESVRAERRWAAPYYWAGFTLAGEWK